MTYKELQQGTRAILKRNGWKWTLNHRYKFKYITIEKDGFEISTRIADHPPGHNKDLQEIHIYLDNKNRPEVQWNNEIEAIDEDGQLDDLIYELLQLENLR